MSNPPNFPFSNEPRPTPEVDLTSEIEVARALYQKASGETIRAEMECKRRGTSEALITLEEAREREFQMYKKWYELEHPGHTLLSRTRSKDWPPRR